MEYTCEICSYIHDGDDLPDMCPVCGAPKSKFKEWSGEDPDLLTDETVEKEGDSFEKDLYGDYEE